MRVNLNLNKYYEGLDLENINEIFSKMLDMKPNIDGLEYLYNESEERFEKTRSWKIAKKIGESALRYQAKDLDKYMRSINRQDIFGTNEEKDFTEEDFRAIIEKYKFLMSEPEKDKENESDKRTVDDDNDEQSL